MKNLNKEIVDSGRLTKQLTIEMINEKIMNDWHWLNTKQKKDLRDLIITTWNAGARFTVITKSKING